jgi:hypothetical protein
MTRLTLGLESFRSAAITITGIEIMHMIREGHALERDVVLREAILFTGLVDNTFCCLAQPLQNLQQNPRLCERLPQRRRPH